MILLNKRKSLEGREDYDQIDFDHFYRNGYDAPFKFWNRKNEVYFVKKKRRLKSLQTKTNTNNCTIWYGYLPSILLHEKAKLSVIDVIYF